MYNLSELKSMLFIDIETVSEYETYLEFCNNRPGAIAHWEKKADLYRNNGDDLKNDELYLNNAALHPEFAKIVVVSIGQISFDDTGIPITSKIKSFYGNDDKDIMSEFMMTVQSIFNKKPEIQFVGHNIKNFDFPFLVRRSIINGVKIPHQLHLHKKKPWENCLLDTYEVWKFGGYGSASLDLICDSLEIPSPKQIMKGNETTVEYWNGNLEKIKEYCEADVKSTMNVVLKISNMPILI